MVMRAIEPPVAPVNTLVPGARNAAPTATTAQMAIRTASTRQNVSLRRIRRRSTMVSASSDIDSLSIRSVTARGTFETNFDEGPRTL